MKSIDSKMNHFSLQSIEDRLMYHDLLYDAKDVQFSEKELKEFRKKAKKRPAAKVRTREIQKKLNEKREKLLEKRKKNEEKKRIREEKLDRTPLLLDLEVIEKLTWKELNLQLALHRRRLGKKFCSEKTVREKNLC